MLADALIEDGLPRYETEGEASVAHEGFDHRKASAGEIGGADQLAADIFARLGRSERQPARSGNGLADTRDLGAFKGDQILGALDPPVRQTLA